jgi:hypothetical protein
MPKPFKASYKPGTCWWCGQTMAWYPIPGSTEKHRGPYGDELFCSLRCAYLYAVQAALAGFKLKTVLPVRKKS